MHRLSLPAQHRRVKRFLNQVMAKNEIPLFLRIGVNKFAMNKILQVACDRFRGQAV